METKMKKQYLQLTAILFLLIFTACGNFYHDLIPPDGNFILSFNIEGQYESEIHNNSINVYLPVSMGDQLDEIIPQITVSPGATIFPITREYVTRAFGSENTIDLIISSYTDVNDMTSIVIDLIKGNTEFSRPVIDLPIDFTMPVRFLVISGLGNVRQYTVTVELDNGEGLFTYFGYEKYHNPQLIRNAIGIIDIDIDNDTKTVTVDVTYPGGNIGSYILKPTFTTNKAAVYYESDILRSDQSYMEFDKPPESKDLDLPRYRTQTVNLLLQRQGFDPTPWTLIVNFKEDNDSSCVIIDFRFTQEGNPSLAGTYMADIEHYEDTGTIDAIVYYKGSSPAYTLRPEFIATGIVTVNGMTQTSGFSSHNFSTVIDYVVTSNVGNNTRTYTVRVTFLQVNDPLPKITLFEFNPDKNPDNITSVEKAVIDDNEEKITIVVEYMGSPNPFTLIPYFEATGDVTVGDEEQTPNINSHNFSPGPVVYRVSNITNPSIFREYSVHVIFEKKAEDKAEITEFRFLRADNSGLVSDVIIREADFTKIDETTFEITATLLFDRPGAWPPGLLTPRWTAQGNVSQGGITRTNGEYGNTFDNQVVFIVTSIDGITEIKEYRVTVKKVNSRIFVNEFATGRNNGNTWEDAYTNMPQACADAALFLAAIFKEIWIAQGTYTPSDNNDYTDYLRVTPNTSYLGGFAGYETSTSQRTNIDSYRAIITGDLGGGQRSNHIFSGLITFSTTTTEPQNPSDPPIITRHEYNGYVSGFIIFEELIITGARARMTSNENTRTRGAGINLSAANLQINRCLFYDLQSTGYGGALYLSANADISDTVIEDCSSGNQGGGIYFSGSRLNIINTTFRKLHAQGDGGGIYMSWGSLNINGTNSSAIFDKCTAGWGAGAIYARSSLEIRNTTFLNCNSGGNFRIIYQSDSAYFRNCVFEHDENFSYLPNHQRRLGLFYHGGTFEECTFTNLRHNDSDRAFIFNSSGNVWPENGLLTGDTMWGGGYISLTNCTFNFGPGSIGIARLFAGQARIGGFFITIVPAIPANRLFMDSCTVNDTSGGIWMFYFQGLQSPGTFRFRNNTHNGQPFHYGLFDWWGETARPVIY